jgi:ATP-binding cassette subfamily B protein
MAAATEHCTAGDGRSMLGSLYRSLWADPYGTPSLIRRVLTEYGARHWLAYGVTVALMAVAAACTAFTAYLIGHVVNEAFIAHNLPMIMLLCAIAIVVFTVKGLALYGQAVLLARIGTELVAESQQAMFDKLLRENLAHFADRPSAAVMAQVTYGAGAVPGLLNLLVTAMGRDGLSLIGLTAVMVMQDPLLSLVALLVMPPAVLFARDLVRRVRNITFEQFAGGAGMLETMQETLQGLRIVKAFGLEDEMRRRVAANAAMVRHAGVKLAQMANRSGPLMEALGGVAVALVFLYGGYRVIAGGATPGEFFSFVTAFLLAYEPAKRLVRLHLELNKGLVGVRMLFECIDSPATEPPDDDRPELVVGSGRIEVMAAQFRYRPDAPVIRGMSFIADPGQITALVGGSGGGKSTVFSLLLRLYELEGGVIRIDGHNIATVSRRSLRRQLAYVGQDVFLFRGSIRENIRFGKPDADDGEIIAAAQAAHAHDFIASLPAGYDTPVGEHGLQLSSGQRQRVAIARALLRNAPIILLDEATAALDTESERHIQDAIARLCAGRTTLVIAHRLNTIVHADRILVVEDGIVVECGCHDQLLREGGRYALLYRMLFRDQAAAQSGVLSFSAAAAVRDADAADSTRNTATKS